MMDAPYYRSRAEAVRAEAARAMFPEIREQLLDIAKQYEDGDTGRGSRCRATR